MVRTKDLALPLSLRDLRSYADGKAHTGITTPLIIYTVPLGYSTPTPSLASILFHMSCRPFGGRFSNSARYCRGAGRMACKRKEAACSTTPFWRSR